MTYTYIYINHPLTKHIKYWSFQQRSQHTPLPTGLPTDLCTEIVDKSKTPNESLPFDEFPSFFLC